MPTKLLIKGYGDAPDAPPLAEPIFDDSIITIGSDASASVRLGGAGVSPEQVVVVNEDSHLLLINRAEGTFLNEEVLPREARRALAHGDRLRIGGYLIIFIFPQPSKAANVASETQQSGRSPLPATREDAFGSTDAATAHASTTTPSPVNGEESAQRNFAAILGSLRNEEDSFYFLVEGGANYQMRITISSAEMALGWDQTGQNISFNAATVASPRALVRKDWSGVVVQAHKPGLVVVNGEPVEDARRLRNGDRLMLVPTAVTRIENQSFLVFYEPASLMVLDSLLPQKLPPPVALQSPVEMAAQLEQTNEQTLAPNDAPKSTSRWSERRIFGYFSFLEIFLMLVGTLLMAVMVFLALEFL